MQRRQSALRFERFLFVCIPLSAVLSTCAFAQQTPGVPQFTISTVAGNGTAGFSGDGGPSVNASLNYPGGVAVDTTGNLYILDSGNNRVRKVANGTISTFVGNGTAGFSGDGGQAINAALNMGSGNTGPGRLCLDSQDNLYVTDYGNHRIRKITSAGIITTVAGNGQAAYNGDNILATAASLNNPLGVAVDASGNIYIADTFNYRIRKVTGDGTITTVVGNGTAGFSGDGGSATSASIDNPAGVAVNAAGTIFISDQANNRIRQIAGGIITTIADDGNSGFAGDDGPASASEVYAPSALALNGAGDLYIPDTRNYRIRLLINGTIWTMAGNGDAAFSGDSGPATQASLNLPRAVTVSPAGAVYIGDTLNNRVRLLTPALPAVNSGGVISAGAFGAFKAASPGSWVEIYGSNLAIDTRSWTESDFTGINAPTSLDGTFVTISGQKAFVDFISPGQVNALIPSNVPTGAQQLTVTTAGGASAAYGVTINPIAPGLLAPPNFNIGGTQYVVAQFADQTYVLPTGAISGLTARPAKPGDTIVIYGVGFGPVTPDIPAGQLVGESNRLATDFHISIGGTPCDVQYDGLAPNYTGLYQLNLIVPQVASGNQPLTFSVDGANGAQTLYVAIGN
jgi:uncharacterized protein (TIGR03437 family)